MIRRTGFVTTAAIVAAAVLVACAAALLAIPKEAGAAFPGQNGRIGGEGEWSPDGTRVVFPRGEGSGAFDGDDSEIFVRDVAGGTTTQLTDNPPSDPDNPDGHFTTDDRYPAWSPDGSEIVFIRDEVTGDLCSQIYVMDSDGSDQRRLGYCNNRLYSPAWSPDGSKIAYAKNGEVWTMEPDGSNQTNTGARRCVRLARPVRLAAGVPLPGAAPARRGRADGDPPRARPRRRGARPRPDRAGRRAGRRARRRGGGLEASDIGLRVDGARKPFSCDGATGRLSRAAGRLPYGKHRVRIVARDAAGNAAGRAWTFRVAGGR